MIICLSPSDPSVALEAKALGDRYNEGVINYENGIKAPSGCQDERLTIVGHGNYEVFGDGHLTPAKLAADLIASGLLRKAKIIDLVGCGIGQIYDQTSYVKQFIDVLDKHGYRNIEIRAFTNLVSEKPIENIAVVSGASTDVVIINGMTTEDAKKFKQELDEAYAKDPIAGLIKNKNRLLETIVCINAAITEIKFQLTYRNHSQTEVKAAAESNKENINIRNQISTPQDNLASLRSKLRECEKQIAHHKEEITDKLDSKYSKQIYKGNDIRRALDNNPNFYHSKLLTETYVGLSIERRQALTLLNNQIASLREDIYQNSRGDFYNMSFLFEKKTSQSVHIVMKKLLEFANHLHDPKIDINLIFFDINFYKNHSLIKATATETMLNKVIKILAPIAKSVAIIKPGVAFDC